MKQWLSNLRPKPQPEPPPALEPEPEFNVSLALNVLYYQLSHERKYHILDLGPALGSNLDFFSQFPCKIYFEDLYRTLTSFDYFSPEDGFKYETVFQYLLPYNDSTHFDIVMTWDLFNYLERDEFLSLLRHLDRFCRKGTLVYALISTLKHIPEKPTTFKILDQERLLYHTNSTVLRSCPQYEQTDLNEVMPDFRICNSFLLRNGFKEYIFVRQ